MRLIVIEDEVFRVTNKECEKLQDMQINDEPGHEKTMQYLDENKSNYQNLGSVYFDCRR